MLEGDKLPGAGVGKPPGVGWGKPPVAGRDKGAAVGRLLSLLAAVGKALTIF